MLVREQNSFIFAIDLFIRIISSQWIHLKTPRQIVTGQTGFFILVKTDIQSISRNRFEFSKLNSMPSPTSEAKMVHAFEE